MSISAHTALLCLLLLSAVACTSASDDIGPYGQQPTDPESVATAESLDTGLDADPAEGRQPIFTDTLETVDLCGQLAGSEYRSSDLLPMGPGPNGPLLGRHVLTFRDKSVVWIESDVTRTLAYTCSDGVITASSASTGVVQGEVSEGGDRLTWNRCTFKQVP